jgi:hypothetical protein
MPAFGASNWKETTRARIEMSLLDCLRDLAQLPEPLDERVGDEPADGSDEDKGDDRSYDC